MKHNKKHHMEYTQPPRNRRRLRVLVDTAVATDVAIVQRVSIGIQAIGVAAILFSLLGSIGVAYNVIQIPGNDVLAAPAVSCVDGTASGQCVVDRTGNDNQRPQRCVDGLLVEDSATCGCPAGRYPWGDGSCTIYPNIKTYNQFVPYCTWTNPAASDYTATCQTELSFVASHFDISTAFTHEKTLLKSINPSIKIETYRNYSALNTTEINTLYPAYCAANGCTTENAFLHFSEDTQRNGRGFGICVPGYNPGNAAPPGDTNTCVTTASDHYARAVAKSQARIPDYWLTSWMMVNFRDPGIISYNRSAITTNFAAGGSTSDVLFNDIGDYIATTGPDLTVSDAYAGQPLSPINQHPRFQEAFDFQVGERDYLSSYFGRQIDMVSNARDTATFFHYPGVADGYKAMGGQTYFEVWDAFDQENDNLPSGGGGRAHYYSLDYMNSKSILQRSLQGQKFILQGANFSTNPDLSRAKMYLLSYFDLLNNSNLTFAYYNYATGQSPSPQTLPIDQAAWVKAAEYNIGQPTTNTLGKVDVLGNSNTTEHFILAEGNDPSTPSNINSGCTGVKQYHVLGRQYTNALVLTKIRDYCGRLGTSSNTTHALPQHSGGNNQYRPLQADGTLGDPITQITLRNSEGAILIPERPAGSCAELWTCSAWTNCSNAQQTRRCTDFATCGSTASKPAESQACSNGSGSGVGGSTPPPISSVTPPAACTPDWSCSAWSTCSNDSRTQQRQCVDRRGCPDEVGEYRDEQLCGAGGTADNVEPTTSLGATATSITTGVLRVPLGGKDNVTATSALRYYYQLDDQPRRVAVKGSTLTVRHLSNGEHTLSISAVDESGNEDPTPAVRKFQVSNVLSIVTAPRIKADTVVRTYDYLGRLRTQFRPFPYTTRWGASVAVLDVEGDGTGEIVLAPGPGGPPEVRVVTATGKLVSKFRAYPATFTGGVNVTAADVNGDGRDEIITAPASGTGPLVRVFTATGKLLAEQTVLDRSFRGGVNVAAGFLDRNEKASLVTAPASAGKPEVSVWELSGKRLLRVHRFATDSASRREGLSLGIANIDGTGPGEIIVTASAGKRPPQVRAFSASGVVQTDFLAEKKTFTGGIAVAAGDLQTFDNRAEIVAVPVSGSQAKVIMFSVQGAISTRLRTFMPYGSQRVGLNVSVGHL